MDLIGNVVESSVNLGNGHQLGELVGSVELTELLVLGSKSLAVTAPGGVELNENVLVVVNDDILVVVGNDDSYGTVIGFGNGLRLDARVNLASEEVVNELANLLLGDLGLLVVGELLVLLGALDSESGPGADLEVKVASVLAEGLGVDGSEVDLALVLESEGLQLLGKLLTFLGSLGEDVCEGNASGHVSGVGLGANLTNEGCGGDLGEVADSVRIEGLGEDVLAVVEGLVEDETGLLDTLSLGQSSVVGGTEEEVVTETVGDRGKGLVGGLVVGGEVGDEDDLVGGLELLECVLGDFGDGGESLLGHVGDQAVGLALSTVGRDILGATEDLEGGVALNAVLLAQICLLCAVDLDEGNVLLLKCGSRRLVLGSKRLAVAAPWREDLVTC